MTYGATWRQEDQLLNPFDVLKGCLFAPCDIVVK
jgi:hypothetical protein